MPKRSSKVISSVTQVKHALPGEYRIEGGSGLLLHVAASGNRSWVYRYRSPLNRRPRRMGLGAFPIVSLASARQRAEEVGRLLHQDRDPLAEKADRERALSVAMLCEKWLTMYAQ